MRLRSTGRASESGGRQVQTTGANIGHCVARKLKAALCLLYSTCTVTGCITESRGVHAEHGSLFARKGIPFAADHASCGPIAPHSRGRKRIESTSVHGASETFDRGRQRNTYVLVPPDTLPLRRHTMSASRGWRGTDRFPVPEMGGNANVGHTTVLPLFYAVLSLSRQPSRMLLKHGNQR
jgi:hypothetical protein